MTAPASPALDPDYISVDTIPTPNPDALMFRVQEMLVPAGSYEFNEAARAGNSPLAEALLHLPGVELVMITPRFVTVRKLSEVEWPELVPAVKAEIRGLLASGDMAVLDLSEGSQVVQRSEVELRIIALIDEEIRPAIAQDGGDLTYMGFEDGIVQLRLIGSCGTCPSSVTTLKMGIERLLVEEIPEVKGVEQV
jgi:Fe-S cluster biogenesis protein NfuA